MEGRVQTVSVFALLGIQEMRVKRAGRKMLLELITARKEHALRRPPERLHGRARLPQHQLTEGIL